MSDLITINTNGLEEAIRCAICENTMKTDNGCDGNCRYDKNTFDKVKEAVNGCIVERPHGEWTEEFDESANPFFQRRWRCSACNDYNYYGRPDFCPCCGADMRKKEGGTE